LDGSELVSTQPPGQHEPGEPEASQAVPVGLVPQSTWGEHAPKLQKPPSQALPQKPQFWESALRSAQPLGQQVPRLESAAAQGPNAYDAWQVAGAHSEVPKWEMHTHPAPQVESTQGSPLSE
jgi:hypothetical protein